jgi:chorismate lyase / 3-hydroxybenzoate synthase
MRAVLPVWPEFVPVREVKCDGALALVGFGISVPGACVTIPARQLGPQPLAEVWRSSLPVSSHRAGDIAYATNGEVLIGTITAAGAETDTITAAAYGHIVDTVRAAGYPTLLRVWNHVGRINEPEREMERYKRFSSGRHEALTSRGYQRHEFPAASAVGVAGAGLSIYFLASREPGVQVENPRQVAAYDYPPVHGPRSPSFARATVATWNDSAMIFVSGTASVVGHETRHIGDVGAQVEETIENMSMIVSEAASRIGKRASLQDLAIAKTYIRRAEDYDRIGEAVTAKLPAAQHLFLESDICRRDLLLEIEGVARI